MTFLGHWFSCVCVHVHVRCKNVRGLFSQLCWWLLNLEWNGQLLCYSCCKKYSIQNIQFTSSEVVWHSACSSDVMLILFHLKSEQGWMHGYKCRRILAVFLLCKHVASKVMSMHHVLPVRWALEKCLFAPFWRNGRCRCGHDLFSCV